MKYLLKTETNGIVSYKIVEQNHELPKGTKYFIVYRPCIYKNVECAIIEKSLNSLVVLFEGEEIRTSYSLVKEIKQGT
jgi:hypothetical protein